MDFVHRFPTIPQSKLLNHLTIWLRAYAESTSGVEMRAKAPVKFDDGSQIQVDALLRICEDAGGKSRVVNDRVVGPPELVIEMYDGVSPSERHRRQVEYSNKGIPESIIVDKDGTSPWFCPGNYVLHSDEDDVTAGTTFPGLKLNLKCFYEEDLKGQLTQLVEGLGSDQHRSFEETLKASDWAKIWEFRNEVDNPAHSDSRFALDFALLGDTSLDEAPLLHRMPVTVGPIRGATGARRETLRAYQSPPANPPKK